MIHTSVIPTASLSTFNSLLNPNQCKMIRRCAISACLNHTHPMDAIFSFPKKDASRRKSWEEFVDLASGKPTAIKNLDNYGVCRRHFKYADYCDITMKKLKPDSIPSIVNGPSSSETRIIHSLLIMQKLRHNCLSIGHSRWNSFGRKSC